MQASTTHSLKRLYPAALLAASLGITLVFASVIAPSTALGETNNQSTANQYTEVVPLVAQSSLHTPSNTKEEGQSTQSPDGLDSTSQSASSSSSGEKLAAVNSRTTDLPIHANQYSEEVALESDIGVQPAKTFLAATLVQTKRPTFYNNDVKLTTDTTNLEAISNTYVDDMGVIWSADKTVLILIPEGVSGVVRIEKDVTAIEPGALTHASPDLMLELDADNPNFYIGDDEGIYSRETHEKIWGRSTETLPNDVFVNEPSSDDEIGVMSAARYDAIAYTISLSGGACGLKWNHYASYDASTQKYGDKTTGTLAAGSTWSFTNADAGCFYKSSYASDTTKTVLKWSSANGNWFRASTTAMVPFRTSFQSNNAGYTLTGFIAAANSPLFKKLDGTLCGGDFVATLGYGYHLQATASGQTLSLVPLFTAHKYTIAYNANGGTGTTASSSHSYGTAKTLTACGFTRAGYTFAGWNTKADRTGTSYTGQQSVSNLTTTDGATITLYAQWNPIYTANINPNGFALKYQSGGVDSDWTQVASTSFSAQISRTITLLPSQSSSSFCFIYADNSVYIRSKMDGSSGTRIMPPSSTTHNFAGWRIGNATTGTLVVNKDYDVTCPAGGSVTLYATWTPKNFKLTLNNQSATTAGTTAIWLKYNTNYYTDSSGTITTTTTTTITKPIRRGYSFGGYYTATNGGGTQIIDNAGIIIGSKTFTTAATTLYAEWRASTASYQVHHWFQIEDMPISPYEYPNYTPVYFDDLYGTTGTTVTPEVKPCNGLAGQGGAGYTPPAKKTATVLADGSLVVNYFYSFKTRTLTLQVGSHIKSVSGGGSYLSYKKVIPQAVPEPGYTLERWDLVSGNTPVPKFTYAPGEPVSMELSDMTLRAVAVPSTTTPYTVNHYRENTTPDTYSLVATDKLTGTTGATVTPAVKTTASGDFYGFTAPELESIVIAGDGSSVVNYYYSRGSNKFSLVHVDGADTTGSSLNKAYDYGATITLKGKAAEGYTWKGWKVEGTTPTGFVNQPDTTFTMPAGNVTITPQVTENTYNLTFNDNVDDASVTDLAENRTNVRYSEQVIVSKPARYGYIFMGFSPNKDATSASECVGDTLGSDISLSKLTSVNGATITLYAIWQLKINAEVPVTTKALTFKLGVPLMQQDGQSFDSTGAHFDVTGTAEGENTVTIKSLTAAPMKVSSVKATKLFDGSPQGNIQKVYSDYINGEAEFATANPKTRIALRLNPLSNTTGSPLQVCALDLKTVSDSWASITAGTSFDDSQAQIKAATSLEAPGTLNVKYTMRFANAGLAGIADALGNRLLAAIEGTDDTQTFTQVIYTLELVR